MKQLDLTIQEYLHDFLGVAKLKGEKFKIIRSNSKRISLMVSIEFAEDFAY